MLNNILIHLHFRLAILDRTRRINGDLSGNPRLPVHVLDHSCPDLFTSDRCLLLLRLLLLSLWLLLWPTHISCHSRFVHHLLLLLRLIGILLLLVNVLHADVALLVLGHYVQLRDQHGRVLLLLVLLHLLGIHLLAHILLLLTLQLWLLLLLCLGIHSTRSRHATCHILLSHRPEHVVIEHVHVSGRDLYVAHHSGGLWLLDLVHARTNILSLVVHLELIICGGRIDGIRQWAIN